LPFQFAGQTKQIVVTEATATNQTKPLILLLHGLSGNQHNMWDPNTDNYNRKAPFPPDQDLGWMSWPAVGIHSFTLDPRFGPMKGWKPVLEAQGFRTAVYDQIDGDGLLARPVQELAVVVQTLITNAPMAKIVILAHSRGGLLARKFIKINKNTALTAPLTKVITLHSPHSGTNLANLANDVKAAIATLQAAFGNIVLDALAWLRDTVSKPSFQELAVGSPFLTDLANGETPLQGVTYHTFGGTSVAYSRVLSWVYTLDSSIPHFSWSWSSGLVTQFHHVIKLIETPVISPILESLPDLTDEITPGKGDMLTSNGRDHLGFSVHHTNALNHAEAQWDPGLQSQVLQIL